MSISSGLVLSIIRISQGQYKILYNLVCKKILRRNTNKNQNNLESKEINPTYGLNEGLVDEENDNSSFFSNLEKKVLQNVKNYLIFI